MSVRMAVDSDHESEQSELDDDALERAVNSFAEASLDTAEEDNADPTPAKQGRSRSGADGTDTTKASYAKVAKPAREPLFVLSVNSGKERRLPMPEEDWKRIAQLIVIKIADHWVDGGTTLAIKWLGHNSGRGLVACLNADTEAWAREYISTLVLDKKSFRAWRRNEYGDKTALSAFLPINYLALGGPATLAMVKKVAPFLETATLLQWAPVKPAGFLLTILVDRAAVAAVAARGPIQMPTGGIVKLTTKAGEGKTSGPLTPSH